MKLTYLFSVLIFLCSTVFTLQAENLNVIENEEFELDKLSSDLPFSEVDSLYFSLAAELTKASPNKGLVDSIFDSIKNLQLQGIQTSNDALSGIIRATPLMIAVQGEQAALQLLGFNSLYLYNFNKKILSGGVGPYFAILKTGYNTQNSLIDLFRITNPKLIIRNWFNRIRSTIFQAGLNVTTPEATDDFNNEVITMIDYTMQVINDLDPSNAIQRALIEGMLLIMRGEQELVVNFIGTGFSVVEAFKTVVDDLRTEESYLLSIGIVSPVTEAVLNAVPAEGTYDFFEEVIRIYQDLNAFLDESAFNDPRAYIEYFKMRKSDLINASL